MKRTDIPHPSMPDTVFFAHEELSDPITGAVRLAPGFAAQLANLRAVFGRPMTVNSCCRSWAHNREIGGHPRSLHVYDEPGHDIAGTAAIDIATPDGGYAWDLIRRAQELGWSVGVGRRFVHLDRRELAGLNTHRAFGYG